MAQIEGVDPEAPEPVAPFESHDRDAVAEALRRSARQAEAADTLWACGRRAEALRLACLSFDGALKAFEDVDPPIGAADRRRIETAGAAAQLPLPSLERDLEDVHTRLFDAWREARELVEGSLIEAAEGPSVVARERRRTVLGSLFFVSVALLLGAWNWAFLPESIEVRATGYRVLDTVETWPPENIIDRDEMTYWHLPPGDTGKIELRFDAPRDIGELRILNAHDLHADNQNRKDRRRYGHASREIVVRAFAGERLLAETEATLARVRDFERQTIELTASGADRVEIEILSFFGEGGGLAEVEVRP